VQKSACGRISPLPTGAATPDDLEEFRSCQIGYMGKAALWNGGGLIFTRFSGHHC